MARWDPDAEGRLQRAALDLYLERGFENVTATDIAERAGLARRTFFRYFADKREVLFPSSAQVSPAVAEAAAGAGEQLPPIDLMVHVFTVLGERLDGHERVARARRKVIDATPELQERERTKLAAVTDGLAEVLRDRGVAAPTAVLLARAGAAVFGTAVERWLDSGAETGFSECVRGTFAELASALGGEPAT